MEQIILDAWDEGDCKIVVKAGKLEEALAILEANKCSPMGFRVFPIGKAGWGIEKIY